MRVTQIGFFEDPAGRAPEQLLAAWPTLVDVAECVSGAGVRVSVIQLCPQVGSLYRNGVDYHFLPPRGRRTDGASAWSVLIRDLAPDVLHVHGLDFPRQTCELAALAPGVPILLQDHASRPPRAWRRRAWRRGAARAAAIAFCAREQARPFADAGLLDGLLTCEVPESTSRFAPGSYEEARRALSLCGDPLVLWVGHLDRNKDPLTVLDGVAYAARALPGLMLYCCFGTARLLRSVTRRISSDPALAGRVHLLGRVPHARVELLMRAADLFVLGSHREGSGYSLIEALACGLPPVVTDIPSFRALTGDGAVGKLWPCDDSRALGEALIALAPHAAAMRPAVRAHFDRELSFAAVGAKLAAIYERVIRRARGRSASVGPSRERPVVGAA